MEVTKQGGALAGRDETATAIDAVALVGRILLAAMFVISGWGKLTGFADTVGYIGSQGLPFPQVLAAGWPITLSSAL